MTDAEKITAEYRGLLVKTEQESQTAYDKAILSLSGGALGLSFVFTKDILGPGNAVHTGWLLASWIAWAFSSTAILMSFLTSQRALRTAIHDLDAKRAVNHPGGWYDWFTSKLNICGLLLFLTGLGTMTVFLSYNFTR